MPTTTLHIGTTKTGSTSIQQFLAKNRNVLSAHGILYPRALGDVPHNVIPAAIAGHFTGGSHQKMYQIADDASFAAFFAQRKTDLAQEVRSAEPEDVIISSEHMHSRCLQELHFDMLKDLLAGATFGRELRIIVYLRPQIDHAISLYTTMLSHGIQVDIDAFVNDRLVGTRRRYHDPKKLLKTWKRQFPSAQLFVRAFDECKNLPEGVITDFSRVTGIELIREKLADTPRANKGMSAWAAEAMRMLNSMNGYDAKAQAKIKRWLRKDESGGKILPTPALSRAFHASFAAENKWVAKHYFGGDQTVLEPNWAKLEEPSPAPVIEEAELRSKFENVLKMRMR